MKCDLTQKVSLLIDGELPPTEAREFERHLDACDDCRAAREDFLMLRRQLADYPLALDAFARQRALRRILNASDDSVNRRADETSATRALRPAAGFAGIFAMPRLNAPVLAALLLLLVGVAAGVYSLMDARRAPVDVASNPAVPAVNNREATAAATPVASPTPNDSLATANKANGNEAVAENNQRQTHEELSGRTSEPATRGAGGRTMNSVRSGLNTPRLESAGARIPKSVAPSSPRSINRERVDVPVAETARNGAETGERSGDANEAGVDAAGVDGVDAATRRNAEVAESGGESKTARHVEQAQLLLRSFRNARVANAGRQASSDLAYEKARSKKLLYENILLRREAASRGNLPVESVLNSLEPILIDIANLPERPAPEDLKEINERMRRKNLVAMLQISAVETASARTY
ncbi:MAG TPA: zf-HC2 domain-containing protein [Pyrinomonadaceae bacterium]|nr:zf-HC2 domain-containing protein [Pyrinomonadaceae bacterium]